MFAALNLNAEYVDHGVRPTDMERPLVDHFE
jgi:hypothetical protein